MIHVVYSSVATHVFSSQELLDLLKVSRANNTERDITGMLLHRNGRFLQALEGPEEELEPLLETILADDRHAACRVLTRERVTERDFDDWSMGFQNLDELSEQDIPGLSRYLEHDFDSSFYSERRSATRLLLNLFKVRT